MGGEPKAKKRRLTKNERRRLKKKLAKSNPSTTTSSLPPTPSPSTTTNPPKDVEVIYVAANPLEQSAPEAVHFKEVFEKFAKREEALRVDTGAVERTEDKAPETVDDLLRQAEAKITAEAKEEEDNGNDNDNDNDKDAGKAKEKDKKLSRKEQKAEKRFLVARLKQTVDRPDVVEVHDVTSSDPHLLIYLKSYRNTAPVPIHWCAKRKYLMGKRGHEKAPWKLPDFIAQTGIAKIRSAVEEKESSVKQRARERMAPKMGRIDIDYAVLHDAFFKYQTKPKLTRHGEVYYEGMENDVTLKRKRPGQLSQGVKDALGMPENAPPPWLINMQRYGPPPSYASMKIPGLNAPIPKGSSFGFHPGGWGKPPVDQFGKPLYGNVFDGNDDGISQDLQKTGGMESSTHWGQFVVEEEAMSESESEDEEEEDVDDAAPAVQETTQAQVASTQQEKAPEEVPVAKSTEAERALDLRKTL